VGAQWYDSDALLGDGIRELVSERALSAGAKWTTMSLHFGVYAATSLERGSVPIRMATFEFSTDVPVQFSLSSTTLYL
jgi:hypothetical protein